MTGGARHGLSLGPLAVLAAVVLLASAHGRQAAASAPCYADSVDQALRILRQAPADDAAAARRAAAVLEACTGQDQREILGDLRANPPDVPDARQRLAALSAADRSPAFAPQPAQARRAVRDILAQPRYDALRQGPTLSDRVQSALGLLLAWLLEHAGGLVTGPFGWLLAGAGALVLAVFAAAVARSPRWTGRREVRLDGGGPPPGPARDRFAEADRLAGAGDLGGAVRALAGGVAVALSGDRAWEASPLTVRELFGRAPDPAALGPLLLVFEGAMYGGRPPGPEAYRRAAEAAAPFRAVQGAAA